MPVSTKYCGGCRASFDRKAEAELAIQKVKDAKAEQGEYFSGGNDGRRRDVLLAVCGCKSCCVDVSPYSEENVVYISEKEDAARAADEVISIIGGKYD